MSLENNGKENNKEGTIRFPIWANNGRWRTIGKENNEGPGTLVPQEVIR